MKVVVRGGGFSNKGAEAMLLTVHREMLQRFPSVETVATIPVESHEKAYVNGITPVSVQPKGRLSQLLGSRRALRIKALKAGLKNKEFKSFARTAPKTVCELEAAYPFDAVIDISGFSYSDECAWGYSEAKETLVWLKFCNQKNVPYFFLPQSWGSFGEQGLVEIVKQFTQKAALIYSRDNISTKHLESVLGEDFVPRTTFDIAFLFEGDAVRAGRHTLAELGIDRERPLIGIAPNMRVYEKAQGQGGGNWYVQLLVKLARHCITELNSSVVLLPHEVAPAGISRRDDRYVCGLVEQLVADSSRCVAVKSVLSAAMTKAVISNLDMLVGSRFHSLVLALSAGVPSFALGWSHKYEELMSDCGLPECCQPFSASLDVEGLVSMIDNVWHNKDEMGQILRGRIPEVQKSIGRVFEQISAKINI